MRKYRPFVDDRGIFHFDANLLGLARQLNPIWIAFAQYFPTRDGRKKEMLG
jgi:hypothetical protein